MFTWPMDATHTLIKYFLISRSWAFRPFNPSNWFVIFCDKLPTLNFKRDSKKEIIILHRHGHENHLKIAHNKSFNVKFPYRVSLMSRSKCSTPTSSASSAPISLGTCSNVFDVGVPSSCTSSTAMYASVGRPRSFGFASIMTNTEFGQYLRINSLTAMSFWCNLGPVWYQPTTRSRAFTFLNIPYMLSK